MDVRLLVSIILLTICLGCSRDNGLPQDLTRHLAQNGVTLKITRSHAPLSSRGGYVVMPHHGASAAKIVSSFNLQPVQTNDPNWRQIAGRWTVEAKPTLIFAAAGRPAALTLKNGSQFEHLYLVIMDDGSMWLFAEYAYG